MFLLLDPVAVPRGKRAARRLRRRLGAQTVRRCDADCPLPFYTLPVAADGPDPAAVIRAAQGRLPLLAPPQLPLPAGAAVFDPAPFYARLLLRSALRLLETAALPPRGWTVTLCDRAGLLADAAPLLLPFAAGVRILTDNPARYARAAVTALRDAGAALQLRTRYTPAAEPELLLLCNGVYTPAMAQACIIADRPVPQAMLLPPAVTLRPLHAALCPAALPPSAFAAALTMLCACPDYRSAVSAALQGAALEAAVRQLRRALIVTDL